MASRSDRGSESEGPGSCSGDVNEATAGDVDWRERCKTLEGQLEKFRLQATKLRSVLGERMQELEEKVGVSTKRAEKAEEEVAELKKKLELLTKTEGKPSTPEQKHAANKRIIALEGLCREKEDIIQHLEQQLREQQDLRAQESLVVESKVTKIKKWVAATVGELEEENKRLVIMNEDANETIRKLKLRLKNQENGQYHGEPIGRSEGSAGLPDGRPDSNLSEDAPTIPDRPTSSSIRDHLIAITAETELNGNDILNRQEVTSEIYDNVEEEPLFALKTPSIQKDEAKKDWRPNRNDSNSNDHKPPLRNGHAVTPGSEMSGSEEDNLVDSADLDHSMSLLSTSSGGLSPDFPLATLAPPPTPCTPQSEHGANLAQSLAMAEEKVQEKPQEKVIPQKPIRTRPNEAVPSTLSLIADSVSATAEMLQNSSKPSKFPVLELDNGETLDVSLPSINRTISNTANPIELDSTIEGFDDDVFLEGGYARSSDYAELLRLRSLSQNSGTSGQEDSYQSLKKFQGKKLQTGVLMNSNNEIPELPELPSSEEGYQSLRNVHEHFDNLPTDPASGLPDVCSYEGGVDEKCNPALDPAFDVDYDEPPDDDSLFMEDSAEHVGIQGSTNSDKPPPPPERKAPSWETRIYALAEKGLKMSPGVAPVIDSSMVTPVPVCMVEEGSSTNSLFRDVDVPVYTTLRGRLTLIRSTPFTGESSDSSDDESGSKPPAPASHSSPQGSFKVAKGGKVIGGSLKLISASGGSPKKKLLAGSSATLPSAGLKRGVSSQSSASDADYSVPPDAVRIQSHDGNSSDEPEPKAKLLKTCSLDKASKSSSDSIDRSEKEPSEKAGWLTKLGGRVKTWKRRWFVLKIGQSELLYYKSPSDTSRKPRGQVPLDKFCKIAPSEGLQTFELATSKRTYYLTAESPAVMEEWIKLIERVLEKYRKPSDLPLALPAGVAMQGWVTKVKLGNAKRCWFVLADRYLHYHKTDKDKSPQGSIDMREARVSEVDQSAASDDEGEEGAEPTRFTLSIASEKQTTTFLNFPSQEEKDSWLYHLMVASGGSGGNSPDGGTEFESVIKKLMSSDSPLSSPLWRHPIMLYSKESREHPLTTLLSDALSRETVKFSKTCNLFISASVDMPAVDYHVNLAQNALQNGLSHTELQNEMYCQLIKQTNHSPASSAPANADESSRETIDHTLRQAWQLLAMMCQLFLPSHHVLWLLKTHLQKVANAKTEVGRYAIFCQRSVERTNRNGRREARPSRLEVLSIVQRHPYYHSKPISIPVHFANKTYQVVGFDSSMTVRDFLRQLNHHSGMRVEEESGFALFSDDPTGKQIQHCLQSNVKICDVISKWEQASRDSKAGKKDGSRLIRLTYKHKEYRRHCVHGETDRERLLLAYQVNSDLKAGRFPISKEMALELASLMAQVDQGDCKLSSSCEPPSGSTSSLTGQCLDTVLDRFYPVRYQPAAENERRKLKRAISEKWSELRGRSQTECVRIYLSVLRRWRHFGACLIPATCKYGKQERVWLTVSETGLSILDFNSLEDKTTYQLPSIVTFGGCRDDFMLVVRKQTEDESDFTTDKLMFDMTKAKVSQLTHLIGHFIRTSVKGKTPAPSGQVTDEKHRKPPQPKLASSTKSSKTTLTSLTSTKSKDSKEGIAVNASRNV